MRILVPIIFVLFITQSCSSNDTNETDNFDEQVSEFELEFDGENDLIFDDDNNEFNDGDIEDSLTST